MIRFTETAKWEDPWFRGLSPSEKLVFFFVVDHCNGAGFYETDVGAMSFKTRLTEEEIEGALKGLIRGIKGASGWLWVRRFLKHQKNSDLNPALNRAHKPIVKQLSEQRVRFSGCPEFKEFIAPYKGLLSPIGIGTGTGKGSAEGGESHLVRPTLEEATAYGAELQMPRDQVEGWFDHFTSNGWKVGGKAPMKDWKAALRNGKRRNYVAEPKAKPIRRIDK